MEHSTQVPAARCYIAVSSANFISNRFGSKAGQQLMAGLSPQTRALMETSKPADWLPIAHHVEVVQAVAAQGKSDQEARELLIDCGKFVAREASNTFLRLLLKVLTPSLLVRKLPDLYRRDFTQGRVEVALVGDTLTFKMFDIAGLDHLPCTSAGFASFALETMGKAIKDVSVHNWSLAEPCLEGSYFEMTWD